MTHQQFWMFVAIVIVSILSSCEVDLFVPSISAIRNYFQVSPFAVEWLMSLNLLTYCLFCLIAGSLGDRYGRKIITLYGLILFVIGSILCVITDTFAILLLGRAIQGVGISVTMLSYVIIADHYDILNQQRLMGYVNAISAITMSIAPVIGGVLTFHFGWRSNFIFLLALGVVAYYYSQRYLYNDHSNKKVALWRSYIPLLKDRRIVLMVLFNATLSTPYWSYVAITPILFVEDLGVSLQTFGLYQGANALVFGTISIFCTNITQKYGEDKVLQISMWLVFLFMCSLLAFGLFSYNDALLFTIIAVSWGAAIVFPVNLIYPYALAIQPEAKGRMSSLIQSARLFLSAISIAVASYFYDATIVPIAIAMVLNMSVCLWLFYLMRRENMFVIKEGE